MLRLPDTRTPDQQWYDCGLICAYCVLDYYGKDRQFARRLSPTPTSGVSPRDLANVFHLAGLRVAQGAWELRTLRNLQSPLIAYVNASDGIDHYVVIEGAASRVHYFDPDTGRRNIPVDQFLARWHSVDRGRPVTQHGMMIQ